MSTQSFSDFMHVKHLRALIWLFIILAACFSTMAIAQTPNVNVSVTGTGPTYDEAKTDAIRKALHYSLKQLVIADRVISGNEVLRDRVLSTSNGYIEKFRESGVQKNSLGFSVSADITVSASRIENFLGVITGGGGEVSGPLLGQEVQRRIAQNKAVAMQAQAREEIFHRLFENYPMGMVDLKLIKINLSPTNPNTLVLDIEQSYKPAFIRTLEETLRALSLHECEIRLNRGLGFFWLTGSTLLCPHNDENAFAALIRQNAPPSSAIELWYANVCVGHDELLFARCFLLDHGRYFRNGDLNIAGFQIFGKFIDANGQSALTRNRCLSIGSRSHLNKEQTLGIYLETRVGTLPRGLPGKIGLWNGFHISTAKLRYQLEIDIAEVNLQKAAHFVAVAGMAKRNGMVVGLTSDPNQTFEPCELVNDVARLHMLAATKAD